MKMLFHISWYWKSKSQSCSENSQIKQTRSVGIVTIFAEKIVICCIFLPHSAVISGIWPWFPTIWPWFPMFLWSHHKEKHCGRNGIHHGRPCGTGSPLWVWIPQKSFAIARDFWNTNSPGWTPFRTGAHDGVFISLPADLCLLWWTPFWIGGESRMILRQKSWVLEWVHVLVVLAFAKCPDGFPIQSKK